MQVRAHERKNIIISGIFVLILAILAGISIFFLGKERSVFARKVKLYSIVHNAQNLKTGAFVQLKGIKIGIVDKIEFMDLEKIKVTLLITESEKKWIREDSYIEFKTQGVLGDKFLEILGGTANSPIVKANSFIKVNEVSGFQNIINKSENIMVTASRVLQKLDRLLDSIEPTTLESTLANLNVSSLKTKDILSNINPNDLKNMIRSLKNVSTRIESGPGTAHSLIYDRALHDDLKAITGGANRSKVLKYFIRESIQKSEDN